MNNMSYLNSSAWMAPPLRIRYCRATAMLGPWIWSAPSFLIRHGNCRATAMLCPWIRSAPRSRPVSSLFRHEACWINRSGLLANSVLAVAYPVWLSAYLAVLAVASHGDVDASRVVPSSSGVEMGRCVKACGLPPSQHFSIPTFMLPPPYHDHPSLIGRS